MFVWNAFNENCEEFMKDSATNVGGVWGYRFCDGTVWCS